MGVARFCAKWGIKLVQATLIPLARSYFPLNCEQADRQIFDLSVKSGLIIGHRNTSPFPIFRFILFSYFLLAFHIITDNKHIVILHNYYRKVLSYTPQYKVLINSSIA